jgi:phasin family protein
MNKTRFQLPPRRDSAGGVDRWVAGATTAAESRQTATTMAVALSGPSAALAPMKFPFMFDMMALLAAQRRNIEAVAAANRILREGAQAVARQNLAAMQQAIDRLPDRVQMMCTPDCPRERAMRQTETAITAYEDATATVRVLGETIQRANTEAMEVLAVRVSEAADEVKSLARGAVRGFWGTEARPARSIPIG